MARKTGVVAQVEKLVADRAYLRSCISSMVAIGRDAPGTIKPAIIAELEKALERTAD